MNWLDLSNIESTTRTLAKYALLPKLVRSVKRTLHLFVSFNLMNEQLCVGLGVIFT